MTVPANFTERHYAEQALLAAVVAERKALAAFRATPPWTNPTAELAEWRTAYDRVNDAADRYYTAVQAAERKPDPVVENIAEAGTFEVHNCPGGAYVITEQPREPHDPDGQFDAADRYDSGYIASPAVADGRAADEFYGKDA